MTAERRRLPNILITGSVGTGKTTLAQRGADELALGLTRIDISQLVESKQLHSGRDAEFDALLLDEERLLDELEPRLGAPAGGVLLDYHGCDFFPERWFDLVLVLRTDNTALFDRLAARGYAENKVRENVTAEIMQVVLDEARDSYRADIVLERRSDSLDDADANLDLIADFVRQWQQQGEQQ